MATTSRSPKTLVDCPLCQAPAGRRHTPGCSWVAMQRMGEDERLTLQIERDTNPTGSGWC